MQWYALLLSRARCGLAAVVWHSTFLWDTLQVCNSINSRSYLKCIFLQVAQLIVFPSWSPDQTFTAYLEQICFLAVQVYNAQLHIQFLWRSNKVGFLSLTYYGVSMIAKALLTYTLYMLNAHNIWHILTSWNLAQQARRSMLAISGSVNISYLGFAKIYNSIKNWVINSCWLSQDDWTFVRLWLQLFNSSGKILNQLF